MKKQPTERKLIRKEQVDEILPEHDFSQSVPNKYATPYAADSTVVVLDPDVAAAFPTSSEANEALRA